jgi:hypothetical protein
MNLTDLTRKLGYPVFVAESAHLASNGLKDSLQLRGARRIPSDSIPNKIDSQIFAGMTLVYVVDADKRRSAFMSLPVVFDYDFDAKRRDQDFIHSENARIAYGMMPPVQVDWKRGDVLIVQVKQDGSLTTVEPERVAWVVFLPPETANEGKQ